MPALRILKFKPTTWNDLRPAIEHGTITGLVIASLLMLLWASNAFVQLRLRLMDTLFLPNPASGEVVVAAVDDDSLKRYGRTPSEWDRALFGALVERLSQAQARVIAFDILFAESTSADDSFIEALQAVRQSEARTRIVMPMVGVEGQFGASGLPLFQQSLYPAEVFRQTSDYLGYVNVSPDADFGIRRQLSLIETPNGQALSFPVAAYLAYLRIPASAQAQVIQQAPQSVQIAERRLKVDERGTWWLNWFSGNAQSSIPIYSISQILDGKINTDAFKDKLVLVGVTNATGLTDTYHVPIVRNNQPMSGVEIHANAIESLHQNLIPSEQSPFSQIAFIISFSLFASIGYSLVRWWVQILGLVISVALWLIFAYVYYATNLELLNLFHPSLALILAYPVTLLLDALRESDRRRSAEALLKQVSELLEETRRQKEEVAQLSAVKTQMIRMASHDLKNPLSRVTAYVSMMRDFPPPNGLDARSEKAFSQIGKAANDMLHIVNDILTLERARSQELQREEFNLSETIRDIATVQQSHAEGKAQHLSMEIEPELWIEGDIQKLRQAFTNLIDNAIKYTPEGGQVRVRVFSQGAYLRFEVQDNGYGIPLEAQKQLFTEFYRVKTRETANITGTGLGLSLVKAVIEQHNGRIGVLSQAGQGSTFWVELKIDEAVKA